LRGAVALRSHAQQFLQDSIFTPLATEAQEDLQVAFEQDAQQRITGLEMRRPALTLRAARIDEAEARQYAELLAKKVRAQLPSPGTEAAKFKGVDSLGSDHYHVTFEHGAPNSPSA
jgi:hypothetical protein